MTPHMHDFVRALAWEADIRGPVLEIGSLIEANQEHLDLRRAFPRGTPYVGVDVVSGSGVDRQASLLDFDAMTALVGEVRPQIILCLYVLEHVWEIQKAVACLGAMWRMHPESWLLTVTHQNQPYHGTGQYGDYWRVTATGMRQLAAEGGLGGGRVLVCPDSSNPTEVLALRHPESLPDSQRVVDAVLRAATASHWEHYC